MRGSLLPEEELVVPLHFRHDQQLLDKLVAARHGGEPRGMLVLADVLALQAASAVHTLTAMMKPVTTGRFTGRREASPSGIKVAIFLSLPRGGLRIRPATALTISVCSFACSSDK